MANLPYISPDLVKSYQDTVAGSSSPATAKRKAISLNRFFDWAETQGHLESNPLQKTTPPVQFQVQKPVRHIRIRTFATIGITAGILVIVFLLVWKLKFPIPFITTPAQETTDTVSSVTQTPGTIPAIPAVNLAWNLFAKMKITDTNGQPVTGAQTLNFKLFNTQTGGSALYTSDPVSVTTDENGSTLISLDRVPGDLFFQNNELFLEPQIGSSSSTLRIPVSTANTAANLGGYYPANPDIGAGPEEVPVINSDGALALAGESPAIKAKNGNLLVEGQAVTIKALDGGGGNIEINPDANGYTHFLFEGSKGNFMNAQAPNLTSGSLYYGMVPNNSTGYYLVNLQNGSKLTTKFSVDAQGNTNMTGGLSTNGTERITSTGALKNITGYSQTSGNFTINQNPGDFASITKNGTALSDVLNLSLNEEGIPGSHYSTLVLNRYGGDDNARALLVNSGNAEFNGQVRLGRFTANPTSIGTGSLVYNTTNNTPYYWNGSTWVSVGTALTIPFSGILSGTNTVATMVVGDGATLDYTGTGTINASSLEGKTWEAPGTIGLTTPNTGAFTTLSANSTVNFSGLTPSLGVYTDGSSNLTSTAPTSGELGYWTRSGTNLYNTNLGDNVGIGDTTPLATLTVGNGDLFQVAGATGNITTAGDLAVNGGDITSTAATFNFLNENTAQTINLGSGTGGNTINIAGIGATGADTVNIGTGGTSADTITIGNAALTTTVNLTKGTTGNIVLTSFNCTGYTNGGKLTTDASGNITCTNDVGGTGSSVRWSDITAPISILSLAMGVNTTAFNWTTGTGANDLFSFTTDASANGTGSLVNIQTGASSTVLPLRVRAGAVEGLTVDASGNVGIGTIGPNFKLDVAGNASISATLSLGPMVQGDAGTCDAASAGKEYYDGTQNSYYYCNGTVWTAIGSGTSYWGQDLGVLYPLNNTVDLLIGADSTASAKFAFTGVNTGGTPTASIAGTIANVATYLTGNGNLATTNMQPLTIGGDTTGNITLAPSNNISGGSVTPGVDNMTDLGTAALKWRNIYATTITGTTIYQGVNQVCDAGGTIPGCGGVNYWGQANGVLYPVNNTVDVLFGSDATASAKFAFTGINTGGTPTASIAGSIANVAMFIDGNGNISTTNGQDLVLGNSSTYSFTGNILLNPLGLGNVGIGTTSPLAKLSVIGTSANATGMATLIVDQYENQDILTASASGTPVMALKNDGTLQLFNATSSITNTAGDITIDAFSNFISFAGDSIGNIDTMTANIASLSGSLAFTGVSPATIDILNGDRLDFRTSVGGDTGLAAVMTILNNGDVGIGLINPAFKLDVSGDVNVTGGYYVNGLPFATSNWQRTLGSLAPLNITDSINLGATATASALIHLAGTAGENSWINTGNVGIGTTSPASKLSIVAPAANATGMAALLIDQYENQDILTASASGATKFIVDRSGNVTAEIFKDLSDPTYYLDAANVGTSLNIDGNIVSNGAFSITSNATNGNITIDAGSGTVVIGAGLGKLDAGTIDPPYTIDGEKYATYLPSMTGVKEETTGNLTTSEYVPGVGYRNVIDFGQTLTGSDLWLFSKVTNLTENFDKMVVLLSPAANTKSWYSFDPSGKLSIFTSRPTSVSYRLTAPRFDFANWNNTRVSENDGFIVPNSNWPINVNLNNSGDVQLDSLATLPATGSSSTNVKYSLADTTGQLIEEAASYSQAVIANIRAGFVIAKEIAVDSFTAFQGTIDNLLITNGLVAGNIQTKLISPLPDSTDVTVQIGSATESGKFAVNNSQGVEVASIDSTGNATFSGIVDSSLLIADSATVSGTLYAGEIKSKSLDEIQALLNQVKVDQNLLTQSASWNVNTASQAATINYQQLAINDLYVTNQAAVNSLSVTNTLTVGSDMVIQSSLDPIYNILNTSIDTLSAPLKLQSLAMAPLEIMAGLVTIDTRGNVNIAGNLYVAGRIHSSGLTLKSDLTRFDLVNLDATESASLLSLQNSTGQQVASVNASGSAQFGSVSTPQLVIAGADATESGTIVDGVITTNSTVGKAVVPTGVSEITIKNPKVTDYTLVYVTPTSSTQNYVLYVKSKQAGQFVVGFTNPIDIDVNFNWWIVQVAQ